MTIEMHRHDSSGTRGDRSLNLLRIQIEGGVLDIHEHRFGANIRNRRAGGNERERRGDNFITRLKFKQPHGDVQSRGAAVEPNALFGPAELREILLKLRHVRPEAKAALLERARDRRVYL